MRDPIYCPSCGAHVAWSEDTSEIVGSTAVEILDKMIHEAVMRGRITPNTARKVASLIEVTR